VVRAAGDPRKRPPRRGAQPPRPGGGALGNREIVKAAARAMDARMHVALLALLLLAGPAPRGAHAQCAYTLALPAGSAYAADGVDEGWCPPFAFAGAAPAATCSNVSAVPPGGVLSYGTCALPGAACTGATALSLRDADSGAVVDAVSRVALNSTVAALSQGCVLGVRCSYGARGTRAERAHLRLRRAHAVGVGACAARA
jgi:hypothetical protein